MTIDNCLVSHAPVDEYDLLSSSELCSIYAEFERLMQESINRIWKEQEQYLLDPRCPLFDDLKIDPKTMDLVPITTHIRTGGIVRVEPGTMRYMDGIV